MSSRLIWVTVKIERASCVFTSAYGPSSEKSEDQIEGFLSELNECVGSFW